MTPNLFDSTDKEDRSKFIRQRRNLMAISLVLLVADVPNEFHTSIGEWKVHPPFTVNMVLWIVWGYWLWRYYTSFHEIEDKDFVRRHNIRMQQIITKIALKRLTHDPVLKQQLDATLQQMKAVGWKYSTTYGNPKANTETLGLMADLGPENNRWTEMPWRPEVTVEGLSRTIANYRAWVYVLFRTSLFSEYVVPFLLAVATIGFGIYRWICL